MNRSIWLIGAIPLCCFFTQDSLTPGSFPKRGSEVLSFSAHSSSLLYKYESVFGSQFQQSLQEMNAHYRGLRPFAENMQLLPEEVLSVVAPETMRYALLKDVLETTSLDLLYVQEGSNMIDFSIGVFQMKPSCAEQIENYCQHHPALLPQQFSLRYTGNSLTEIRAQRLQRLQNRYWQYVYTCAFCAIVQDRFPEVKTWTSIDRVEFMSNAYNLGLHSSEKTIRHWSLHKAFPFGAAVDQEKQFSYSEIALDVYKFIVHPKPQRYENW